ncbi:hypothetical protein [Rickettsia hoogstraalii]|uniref:hypothetical protein n=1 Tax=Rickettsia hoogstraalii TaxID=467174 RepID=UPI000AB9526D|nr:hypothetical protein [Rickettsia hoogstraalii]
MRGAAWILASSLRAAIGCVAISGILCCYTRLPRRFAPRNDDYKTIRSEVTYAK